MRPLIPVPTKGEKLRATWGSAVTNRVNELCAMAPSGVLQREGFGGIGAQPLPKNLRDRPAAVPGSMPFDIKASIETSQDGTQKRLVIQCRDGNVIWCGPSLATSQNQTPGSQADVPPWRTIFTGTWAEELEQSTYAIFLHYRLALAPEWDTAISPLAFVASGTNVYYKVMAEAVQTIDAQPATTPYGAAGLYYALTGQTLVAWMKLGIVNMSSIGSVTIEQRFHGDLVLSDLLAVNGGGEGVGGEAESARRGCWRLAIVEDEEGEEGTASTLLQDCYYNVGGITKKENDRPIPGSATGFLCAIFSAAGVDVQLYPTLGALNTAQADETRYIVPLYEMDDGDVVLDMRNAPQIQVFEGTL